MTTSPSPSDLVAQRLKETRKRSGYSTTKALAERCREVGVGELSAAVLMNIESGRRDEAGRRRRDVTVDELLALARALEISPLDLLPLEELGPSVTSGTLQSARFARRLDKLARAVEDMRDVLRKQH